MHAGATLSRPAADALATRRGGRPTRRPTSNTPHGRRLVSTSRARTRRAGGEAGGRAGGARKSKPSRNASSAKPAPPPSPPSLLVALELGPSLLAHLAHPDGGGRHLDKLGVLDVLDRLLERDRRRRREVRLLVGAGGAHVRQLLLAADVDLEVAGALVDADDLVLVHLVARRSEERAPLLRILQAVPRRRPLLVREQVAAIALVKVARPRLVPREGGSHDRQPARRRHELGLDTRHGARRDLVLQRHDALWRDGPHLEHVAVPLAQHRDDGARVLLRELDVDQLKRLAPRPLDFLLNHLWAANHQLEALAPHRLDQHRQVEQPPPVHL
mmetsp:Transcript_17421/g.52800  ORF Transcript_17421/g.52800 Transcript_17421/m.52800 type:complete len:329 (-) Transcript_17421:45-1031(-)